MCRSGHIAYRGAVEYVFGSGIDNAQLIKQYGKDAGDAQEVHQARKDSRTRSPAKRSASSMATLIRR
jgi:hypothetical protein